MVEAQIRVAQGPAELIEAAAKFIAEEAQQAIAQRGKFSIALSGGSTPKPVYARLAADPYRLGIDWSKVSVYFGDERCVGPDSDQSNYRMAREALLSHVTISESQVHRMHGEDDPNAAAIAYGKLLKEHFGDGGVDLNLLGMGPDGHTASLFPHTAGLNELEHRCVANYVPQQAAWRITTTAPFINRSRTVAFLVQGAEKAERVRQVMMGQRDEQNLPSQLIAPHSGRLIWLMDQAAARLLPLGK